MRKTLQKSAAHGDCRHGRPHRRDANEGQNVALETLQAVRAVVPAVAGPPMDKRYPPSAGSNASLKMEAPVSTITNALVLLIALLHGYFLVLEMFLWDRPIGLRAFGQTLEAARASKVLAANQGLYNGFLAAGLLWGLWLGAEGVGVKVFFLCCVLLAGLFGAATANRKILYIQAVPAAVALCLMLWS